MCGGWLVANDMHERTNDMHERTNDMHERTIVQFKECFAASYVW